ncbi:MAG: hypothetical protein ABWY16_20970 [Pedobacter sp.]|jgi:hypothetical protein|uniref:hypothetical protein n=1 Tax=Pedobacter sp. TaxID=1411316 RepID=UPI00339A205F
MEDNNNSALKAIRLYNTSETECAFETGTLPTQIKIDVSYFFGQTKVDAYEKVPHPAPRRQYVVTLKGKLRFKVSDGSTFIVEPGIILIAEDVTGPGHSWEIIDGDQWERLYIPLDTVNDSHFMRDPEV